MDYKTGYAEFIKWITDPSEMGEMGPVEYTKGEDAFAKLFAAYLNCKHQPNTAQVVGQHAGCQ